MEEFYNEENKFKHFNISQNGTKGQKLSFYFALMNR